MMLRMRTTLNINDALLDEVRRRAEAAGKSFRSMLEEVIALGLASANSRARRRVRTRPRPLGLKPAYYNISLNQLFDQMEAERTTTESDR